VGDQRQYVERVLDVALYAPVGLALTLRDRLPGRLRQGRQALENRVQLARFVGELAVRYGKAEIERELRERRDVDAAATRSNGHVPDALATAVADATLPAPVLAITDGALDGSLDAATPPRADSLPISDYESLAAIHVVQRLSSLRDDEIEQIRQFETAHRARRTILAKIAQLQHAGTP
jgi:hypothetical protein